MTLLLKATHIDIAIAMALWILRHGTSSGEYRRRMTLRVRLLGRGYQRFSLLNFQRHSTAPHAAL